MLLPPGSRAAAEAAEPGLEGHRALHRAAMFAERPMLEWLLTNVPGLHVDASDVGTEEYTPAGVTALHLAALNRRIELVKWLIGAGADPT